MPFETVHLGLREKGPLACGISSPKEVRKCFAGDWSSRSHVYWVSFDAVRCADVRSQAKPKPIAHYRQKDIDNLNVEWKAKATGSQNAMAYGYSNHTQIETMLYTFERGSTSGGCSSHGPTSYITYTQLCSAVLFFFYFPPSFIVVLRQMIYLTYSFCFFFKYLFKLYFIFIFCGLIFLCCAVADVLLAL